LVPGGRLRGSARVAVGANAAECVAVMPLLQADAAKTAGPRNTLKQTALKSGP
jgi:hypothetical protein